MKRIKLHFQFTKSHRMICCFLLILVSSFSSLFKPPTANSQDILFPEYEIKATFLYNFIKFIKWPETNLSSYYICILGEDPFGKAIETIHGKTVASYPIKIKYIKSISEFQTPQNCHILFISASEKD